MPRRALLMVVVCATMPVRGNEDVVPFNLQVEYVMSFPSRSLLILLCVSLFGFSLSIPVGAQTACPAGAAAGSRMCGPDGGSQNVQIVRHEGYGAYVDSMSARISYSSMAANSDGMEGVIAEAMASCRRAGNNDCQVIGTWRNSCASVGSVMVDGISRPIFATGSSGRASKRAVKQECERISPAGRCTVAKRPRCVDFRTDLVPY